MTASVLPQGKQQYFTTAGVPAIGYKLATFDAGTTNPRTTWQDAAQVSPNTNPIILDARGEAVIFWSGAYKAQLQDSTGAVIWTVDNIAAPDLTQAALGLILYPRTAAEIAASVTPTNYAFPPYDVRRYGAAGRWPDR
jgi:hypothetical protein